MLVVCLFLSAFRQTECSLSHFVTVLSISTMESWNLVGSCQMHFGRKGSKCPIDIFILCFWCGDPFAVQVKYLSSSKRISLFLNLCYRNIDISYSLILFHFVWCCCCCYYYYWCFCCNDRIHIWTIKSTMWIN